MIKLSSPVPRPSIWRGKSPALADLGAMLEFVSEPALILERVHGSILFVNSAFLSFSAYSITDLVGHPFQEFFQDPIKPAFPVGEETIARFLRKYHTLVDVNVCVDPIDANGQWVMCKFQQDQRELQWNWQNLY